MHFKAFFVLPAALGGNVGNLEIWEKKMKQRTGLFFNEFFFSFYQEFEAVNLETWKMVETDKRTGHVALSLHPKYIVVSDTWALRDGYS